MTLKLFLNVRLNNYIGNAAVAGMTTDLKLEGNQLNIAVTVFYGMSKASVCLSVREDLKEKTNVVQ